MAKEGSVFDFSKGLESDDSKSRIRGLQGDTRKQLKRCVVTGSRTSIGKAVARISLLMNANDDAIDDLFEMIDNWEEITGRPFYTDSFVETRTTVEPVVIPASKPVEKRSYKPSVNPDGSLLAQKAEAILRERNLQRANMPPGLESDEYVRILIVVLIEVLEGKEVPLTSIGYAIERPQTTVMRYLKILEKNCLIWRDTSDSDGRYTLIKLTEKGRDLAEALVSLAH
ncbi:MAG: winged helix DNA-binding protein [Pseudomonadota bacterium]